MNFRRMIVSICILFIITFTTHTVSAGDATIQLFMNDKQLESEVPPMIMKGNTLVPVRIIAEEIGATVDWHDANQKVRISKNDKIIEIFINQKTALVNGVPIVMNVSPLIIDQKTILPLRFIGEQLDVKFIYDSFTHSVYMFKKIETLASPKVDELLIAEGESETVVHFGDVEDDTDPSQSTTSSDLAISFIHGIKMTSQGLVVEARSGELKPTMMKLTNPNRLVFDFPNSTLESSLLPLLSKGIGEFSSTHPNVKKIRFSNFSDDPMTVRVTLDLIEPASYIVVPTSESHVFRANLTKSAYHIVIDPGHGGKDPGSEVYSGVAEKDFNLSVSKQLRDILAQDSRMKITLTRSDDRFISLNDRVDIANTLGADVFISIHANSYIDSKTRGVETFYARGDSVDLAQALHRVVLQATGFPDRSVRISSHRVTRNTTMPAVLLELGYLSNANDAKALMQASVQQRLATSLAASIIQYVESRER